MTIKLQEKIEQFKFLKQDLDLKIVLQHEITEGYSWKGEQLILTKYGELLWEYISGCSCDSLDDYGEVIDRNLKQFLLNINTIPEEWQEKIIEKIDSYFSKELQNCQADLNFYGKEYIDKNLYIPYKKPDNPRIITNVCRIETIEVPKSKKQIQKDNKNIKKLKRRIKKLKNIIRK